MVQVPSPPRFLRVQYWDSCRRRLVFFGCERGPTDSWKTYANKGDGYRLRYPEKWRLWDREELSLCSPRIKFPCGPTRTRYTPPSALASVNGGVVAGGVPAVTGAGIQRPAGTAGLVASRHLQPGQSTTTTRAGSSPPGLSMSKFTSSGKGIYTITSYTVDSCPNEFERVLATFEFTNSK